VSYIRFVLGHTACAVAEELRQRIEVSKALALAGMRVL
jgi:hypothetical protein